MGEDILESPQVTRFAGGKLRGRCYQINSGADNVQLTRVEAIAVAFAILADNFDGDIHAHLKEIER